MNVNTCKHNIENKLHLDQSMINMIMNGYSGLSIVGLKQDLLSFLL